MKKIKADGITLIALVITIIIMVILAGVTLNATIGENGIISNAQYSTFVSEMTEIEDALKIWKTSKTLIEEDYEKKAPTNGLCSQEELLQNARLIGEIGYYRVWSVSNSKPSLDFSETNEKFNGKYESEFIYYPAGVQDLYYLNNEELGINKKKKYLIDAATGMIYSLTGINLKGIQCYSLEMAKTIMDGYSDMPSFAELEISSGKNAGNVSNKYKVDENGNYILDESGNKIENTDYNPYGFQIIADSSNDNIYKLYNNGDLYAKGLKGYLLNSSEDTMNEINSNVWQEFKIPDNIPGSQDGNVTLIPGSSTMYIIDSENYLWAWGDNSYNKLGLTDEQKVEYTGLVPTKLDIGGKKVYKVFDTSLATFVITNTSENYELYACGHNVCGQLGTGIEISTQSKFMKVELNENPRNIINITANAGKDVYNLILVKNNTRNKIYFAGSTVGISGYSNSGLKNIFKNTELEGKTSNKFIEIFNGIYGAKLSYNVVNLYRGCDWNSTKINLLDNNGNLYRIDSNGNISEIKINDQNANIKKFVSTVSDYCMITKEINGDVQFWCNKIGSSPNIFGNVNVDTSWKLVNDYMPEELNSNDVKDYIITYKNVMYLMNDGKLWATGKNTGAGVNISTGEMDNFVCLTDVMNLPLMDSFIRTTETGSVSSIVFLNGKDGKIYSTGDSAILFGEKVLQKSWTKIASNVKKFNAKTTGDTLGYIDNNNDLWILGADSSYLGMNSTGSIRNFVRLKDCIKDTDMYSHIDGKVVDYVIGSYSLRILTDSSDNNTVYVSGYVKSNTWYVYNGLGVAGEDDKKTLTKVIDNVKYYNGKESTNMAITKDNKLYSWGFFDGNDGFSSYYSPKEISVKDLEVEQISAVSNIHHYNKFIITKNSKLYVAGYGNLQSTKNGLGFNTNSNFTIFPEEAFDGKEVIDIVCCANASWIVLTDDGNLWGVGNDCDLGIGKTGTSSNVKHIKIYSKGNILQICGGNGWFVAVTTDGSVYGTGSNKYGILGRWVGIDRKTPNSRYKTAFDWAECPELEI